jgi:hypothetical protein
VTFETKRRSAAHKMNRVRSIRPSNSNPSHPTDSPNPTLHHRADRDESRVTFETKRRSATHKMNRVRSVRPLVLMPPSFNSDAGNHRPVHYPSSLHAAAGPYPPPPLDPSPPVPVLPLYPLLPGY